MPLLGAHPGSRRRRPLSSKVSSPGQMARAPADFQAAAKRRNLSPPAAWRAALPASRPPLRRGTPVTQCHRLRSDRRPAPHTSPTGASPPPRPFSCQPSGAGAGQGLNISRGRQRRPGSVAPQGGGSQEPSEHGGRAPFLSPTKSPGLAQAQNRDGRDAAAPHARTAPAPAHGRGLD